MDAEKSESVERAREMLKDPVAYAVKARRRAERTVKSTKYALGSTSTAKSGKSVNRRRTAAG